MIDVSNVSKNYKKNKALMDFNASFENLRYGLLGPNGSGKTTLFRILTGLIVPTAGSITHRLDGEKRPIRIGYLPQLFGLLPELSLKQHLLYFADLKKIPKHNRLDEISRVIDWVGLSHKLNQSCKTLSGGMVRRAGIAQALIGQPDIVLFDEPTAGLDPEERLRFKLIIESLPHEYPIVLATHIVEDVDALCDQVIVLNKGQTLINDKVNRLTQQALGKSCVVNYHDLSKIQLPHRVIRMYTDSSTQEKMVRLLLVDAKTDLSDETLNHLSGLSGFSFVPPTLEDGYISLIMR